MFFNQNSGFGKLKGYLTKFSTVSKCYQNHSNASRSKDLLQSV